MNKGRISALIMRVLRAMKPSQNALWKLKNPLSRQKLRKRLLGLLPIALAYALSDYTLKDFGLMLVGGLFFWIPYWLAWWLSDGFSLAGLGACDSETIASDECVPHPAIWEEITTKMTTVMSCGINPYTGKPCTVIHYPSGGKMYMGGF